MFSALKVAKSTVQRNSASQIFTAVLRRGLTSQSGLTLDLGYPNKTSQSVDITLTLV